MKAHNQFQEEDAEVLQTDSQNFKIILLIIIKRKENQMNLIRWNQKQMIQEKTRRDKAHLVMFQNEIKYKNFCQKEMLKHLLKKRQETLYILKIQENVFSKS